MTPDRTAEILRLHGEGLGQVAIAERLGITRHTVRRAVQGLPGQRRGPKPGPPARRVTVALPEPAVAELERRAGDRPLATVAGEILAAALVE